MRLSDSVKKDLIASIHSVFGPVPILLFGSRLYDDKRGGDIDIAIQIDVTPETFEQKRISVLTLLARINFPLPVDIVQYHPSMPKLLQKEIDQEGILLTL